MPLPTTSGTSAPVYQCSVPLMPGHPSNPRLAWPTNSAHHTPPKLSGEKCCAKIFWWKYWHYRWSNIVGKNFLVKNMVPRHSGEICGSKTCWWKIWCQNFLVKIPTLEMGKYSVPKPKNIVRKLFGEQYGSKTFWWKIWFQNFLVKNMVPKLSDEKYHH